MAEKCHVKPENFSCLEQLVCTLLCFLFAANMLVLSLSTFFGLVVLTENDWDLFCRWSDESMEWMHEKDDRCRVWPERGQKYELLLYMNTIYSIPPNSSNSYECIWMKFQFLCIVINLVLNWGTILWLLSEHLGNIIISGHSDATWVQFREPFKTTWRPGIVYC